MGKISAVGRRGRYTPMVDGANNTTSLDLAQIGISMGMEGSDVTKDASKLVSTGAHSHLDPFSVGISSQWFHPSCHLRRLPRILTTFDVSSSIRMCKLPLFNPVSLSAQSPCLTPSSRYTPPFAIGRPHQSACDDSQDKILKSEKESSLLQIDPK